MLAFLVRRSVAALITLTAASIIVFLLLAVLPGDAAQVLMGTEGDAEALAALRDQLGLAGSLVARYLNWVGGLLSGDLGLSATYATPISGMLADRLQITVPLAGMAVVLSTLIALPLGMLAATQQNRPGDYGVMAFTQIGLAIPSFWLGILFVLLFSIELQWFDMASFPGWADGPIPAIAALLLPALALAVSEAAILARVTRGAVLDTLREDYVRTARAKGLSPGAVLWHHVLRNALIPVTTIIGLQVGFLLAGTVVVEAVFTLPGLGQLLLLSINNRDLLVVQAIVMLAAAFVILVNLAVDILYALIDPRVRRGTGR